MYRPFTNRITANIPKKSVTKRRSYFRSYSFPFPAPFPHFGRYSCGAKLHRLTFTIACVHFSFHKQALKHRDFTKQSFGLPSLSSIGNHRCNPVYIVRYLLSSSCYHPHLRGRILVVHFEIWLLILSSTIGYWGIGANWIGFEEAKGSWRCVLSRH